MLELPRVGLFWGKSGLLGGVDLLGKIKVKVFFRMNACKNTGKRKKTPPDPCLRAYFPMLFYYLFYFIGGSAQPLPLGGG